MLLSDTHRHTHADQPLKMWLPDSGTSKCVNPSKSVFNVFNFNVFNFSITHFLCFVTISEGFETSTGNQSQPIVW